MAFELMGWKTTGTSWARGEQVEYIPPSDVGGAGDEEEKLPWLPAAAVVGVLGAMFFWTKLQAQKHSQIAQSSIFAPIPEPTDEENLQETSRLPPETMKQLVFGNREKPVT